MLFWRGVLGVWKHQGTAGFLCLLRKRMTLSSEHVTCTVLVTITVVPTAALVLTHPKPPTGSAGHRPSLPQCASDSQKVVEKDELY